VDEVVDPVDGVWVVFAVSIYSPIVGFGLAALFAVYFWKFRKALPEEAVTTSTTRRIQTVSFIHLILIQH